MSRSLRQCIRLLVCSILEDPPTPEEWEVIEKLLEHCLASITVDLVPLLREVRGRTESSRCSDPETERELTSAGVHPFPQ